MKRFHPLLACAVLACATAPRAEVLIERTMLPDAPASSFAIGLPGGVNFCFDAVTCSVRYAWTGGFLDLTGVRPGPGKFISPAKPLGPVEHLKSSTTLLRDGSFSTVLPLVEFKGYTLHADAVEFRYTLDGVPVRQEIRARPGGNGLMCWLRIERSDIENRRSLTTDLRKEINLASSTPWKAVGDKPGLFFLEHVFNKPTP